MSSSSSSLTNLISLLPTVEFLETIERNQWNSDSSYFVGFSLTPPSFFSSTNDQLICTNNQSELLSSLIDEVQIVDRFSQNFSAPILISSNTIKAKPQKKAKSLCLFRSQEDKSQIILNANIDFIGSANQTCAPLAESFSDESLLFFDSKADWFIGFGSFSDTLEEYLSKEDNFRVCKTNSEDILSSVVHSHSVPVDSFQAVSASTSTPFASITIGTAINYISEPPDLPDINLLFLFSVNENDSVVAFAGQFSEPQKKIDYEMLLINVEWDNRDIVII